MKKALSILLVIALSALFFTGCGESPSASGDADAVDPTPTGDVIADLPTPTPTQDVTVDPTPTPTQDVPVDPTPTPSEGGIDKPTPTPPPDYDPDAKRPHYAEDLSDVIKFNLYDMEDGLSLWTDAGREWMLNNYHLAVDKVIYNVWVWPLEPDFSSADVRQQYNTMLAEKFLTLDAAPDYLPAVYISSVGQDACFRNLSEYLTDLSPYIEEGQILSNYVTWLWNGEEEYWNAAKEMIEVDGALYALPRREMMPAQRYLCYEEKQLGDIGYGFGSLPETWDGFVDMLRAFKNVSADKIPFVQDEAKMDTLLQFIAATYGLDFNMDFSWTTKNGEPLWTYYWDEYLEILKRANELAAEGLVYTDALNPNRIVHYNMDDKSAGRKHASRMYAANSSNGVSIASYTTSSVLSQWNYNSGSKTEWKVSPVVISQPGKQYSLIASSQLDTSWVAIGNRLGEEFTLRICDMLSYSASDEGFLRYFFGKEGIPFADSVEEAGNFIWVYDEAAGEMRIRGSVIDGLMSNTSYDPEFWASIDEHYALFPNGLPDELVWSTPGNHAGEYGITDTGFFPSRKNFRVGTTWYADETSYPERYTVYWEKGSNMGKYDMKNIKLVNTFAKDNNSIIYNGFYKTPQEALGDASSDIQAKIDKLSVIAKQFTIAYLSGEKSDADWNNYIDALQSAGYNDVYEFYMQAAYSFPTKTVSTKETQSFVNAIHAK